MGSKSSKNVRSFGISKIQEIQELAGFGDGGMEIGFDQLCRGVKLKSLHPGTTITLQNREKSKKNVENPGFCGGGGGGVWDGFFAVFFLLKEGPYSVKIF